ncbi:MAG TPA: sulfotransferase family protein [Nocardioidaceae bacterium]|nr:sulfotransferase family protein [Nocardioidaceae bacterium]
MSSNTDGQLVEGPEPAPAAGPGVIAGGIELPPRRMVLVVGSGRSGTSTMSGTLQRLGLHVPQPEVGANKNNPKGFGEPRWVVDLHKSLLRRANVMNSDARPSAWPDAGRISSAQPLQRRVHTWLEQQFVEGGDELVIKDPRLGWFVGLWRAAALRSGAAAAFVTMLRPVTEVVGSKATHYKPRFGDVHAVAAWVNVMLSTELSTRGSARAFVRYDDMLTDWTIPLFRIAERFNLTAVKSATDHDVRAVHDFIDPSLRRVHTTWLDVQAPPRLREIADESWQALDKLADPEGDVAETHSRLDEVRSAYADLYAESEAIAQSSIAAARGRRRTPEEPPKPPKGRSKARAESSP